MFGILNRRRIQGDGFTVIVTERSLFYEEGDQKFLINTVEGDGHGIVVEEMADADLALQSKSLDERLTIAQNIKRALAKRGITIDIYQDHHLVP